MTKSRRQSFRFRPDELDQLAAASSLGRQTADFESYADRLRREVELSMARRAMPRDWVPSAKVHRKARAVAQKAAALLAELKRLRAPDRALLRNLRNFLDSGGAERLTDRTQAEKWRSQLLFVFLSARRKRPAPTPVWLPKFIAELDLLRQIAQAAAHVKKPPHRGRRADAARIIFGREIASAFYWHVRRKPTKGRNSNFERTLRVCLAAAGEYPGESTDPRDLHTLVATILDGVKFRGRVPIIRLVP